MVAGVGCGVALVNLDGVMVSTLVVLDQSTLLNSELEVPKNVPLLQGLDQSTRWSHYGGENGTCQQPNFGHVNQIVVLPDL